MNSHKILIDIVCVAFGAALLTACPDDKSAEETGPASSLGETTGTPAAAGETGSSEPAVPQRPEATPLLCAIDSGKWCTSCAQDGSGSLCCAGASCSVWSDTGAACEGVVGWCNSYSVSATDPKAVVCHN